MNTKRREFIKTAALASGAVLTGLGNPLQAFTNKGGAASVGKFGLQLYSLRDDLPKDPKGVLKQVASFGYKQVESFEGPKGIFWGMSNTEFKKYLDGLGMQVVSSHCNYKEDFERKAAEAAAIGMKYLMCPYLGRQKSLDAYKEAADTFNKCGEICKKNGIRFAYHNHDYSFKEQDGQFPQDVMMKNSDPSLVDFEMDIYWVVNAGQDPLAWFKKYPDRFRLGHVKDGKGGETVTLGTGTINFASILKEGQKSGMKYFIVEQEQYTGTTPLVAAKADAAYMKKLSI